MHREYMGTTGLTFSHGDVRVDKPKSRTRLWEWRKRAARGRAALGCPQRLSCRQMAGDCGIPPEDSWVPSAGDVVTTKRFPTKLGDVGMEAERLVLEFGEGHSQELITFSFTQETWMGNTTGPRAGYTAVVQFHSEQGTAHQHWYGRSQVGPTGEVEFLGVINGIEDVDKWRKVVSQKFTREWKENKVRWSDG